MELIRPDINLNFVGKRKLFLMVSLSLIVLSILVLLSKGMNYGIDFTGGTLVQVQFKKQINISKLRASLKPLPLGDTVIQNFGSEKEFLIRVQKSSRSSKGLESDIKIAIENTFGKNSFKIRRTEMVGPKVGADLRNKALSSMFFALIGILIYVSFRFRFRQAVASVIALIHDVLITVAIFAFSGKEFSLPIVAAVLTIIGYSLNDTIVVFDRIRENSLKSRRQGLFEIVNMSINQTLSRTILTSGTTLVAVLAFLFLGGEIISDVAFTLVVGIIAGTYSSIYVASSFLLVSYRSSEPHKKK